MKKYYITFGGQAYDVITQNVVVNAPKFGADEVLIYDDLWLSQQEFFQMNQWLWKHHNKRGFGWYCWKPFIIWKTLEMCEEGDIVLYADGDSTPIGDLTPLYNICHQDGGIMLFAAEHNRQIQWCKADCYIVMGQLKDMTVTDTQAGVARFMVFEKGPWKSTQFLMEWLTYCINPLATTFDSSLLATEEHPEFHEHRTEQAIMSNLAHKYKLKLYREADEGAGNATRDMELYPQVFTQYNPNCYNNMTHAIGNGSKFRNIDVFMSSKKSYEPKCPVCNNKLYFASNEYHCENDKCERYLRAQ